MLMKSENWTSMRRPVYFIKSGIQGLLRHPRGGEDGDGQGTEGGIPEAGPEAPSRRQSRGQERGDALQGDQRGLRGARRSREAAQVRRARRQLAHVRTGAAA